MNLNGVQLKIWNTLQNLEDEQRIVGQNLMDIVGISDVRSFRGTIEDMRLAGYQIGASKGLHNPGYYCIRTDKEAWDFHFRKITALEREMERLAENTEQFFVDKYGQAFDFFEAKSKEEVRRFGTETDVD